MLHLVTSFASMWLLVVGLALVTGKYTKLAALKSKILESSGDFSDGTGAITLTVSTSGLEVPLPKFLQKATWQELGQGQETLSKAGYKYWMPQNDGFLFKNDDDTKRVSCVNNFMGSAADDKVELQFSCTPVNQGDARFKVVPSYVPVATSGVGNQFTTFWMPVSNGCPYGWNNYNWGSWSYPYYAVTPMGYWGCSSLTTTSACSSNPYFYPFSS